MKIFILVPRCPAADLFGHKGRAWLATQDLPPDELAAAAALPRQRDFHAEEPPLIDADMGQVALGRAEVPRLMKSGGTLPFVESQTLRSPRGCSHDRSSGRPGSVGFRGPGATP